MSMPSHTVLPRVHWVPPVSILRLEGQDRLAFLQNFCTNDLRGLDPGGQREAFITDVRGKTLAHGFVLCRADDVFFVSFTSPSGAIFKHLDRYHIREAVTIHDLSLDYAACVIAAGTSPWPPDSGADATVIWLPLPMDPPHWLGLVPNSARDRFNAALQATGVQTGTGDEWDAARILAGFPLSGLDVRVDNLPQEVARDPWAISFSKGCYLGQETVARIDALGHVNRLRMVACGASTVPPAPGMELYALEENADRADVSPVFGVAVGQVTSSCHSVDSRATEILVMGYVRREFSRPGTRLVWSGGRLEVIATPGIFAS